MQLSGVTSSEQVATIKWRVMITEKYHYFIDGRSGPSSFTRRMSGKCVRLGHCHFSLRAHAAGKSPRLHHSECRCAAREAAICSGCAKITSAISCSRSQMALRRGCAKVCYVGHCLSFTGYFSSNPHESVASLRLSEATKANKLSGPTKHEQSLHADLGYEIHHHAVAACSGLGWFVFLR